MQRDREFVRRFAIALTAMMKAYPERGPLDEMDFELWMKDLEGLPVEAIEEACATLRRGASAGDFAPRPGDVRSLSEDWVQYKQAKKEQLLLEDGAKDFRNDPRLGDVMPGRGHWTGNCRQECIVCAFEAKHPKAYLHLRDNLVAGQVNWDRPVVGCCGTETVDTGEDFPHDEIDPDFFEDRRYR